MYEEWRGPHQFRELELIKAGVKPLALLGLFDFKINRLEWLQLEKEGKVVIKQAFGEVFIAKSNESWRIDAAIDLFEKKSNPNWFQNNWRYYHVTLGRLLGYKDEHIEKFLEELENSEF